MSTEPVRHCTPREIVHALNVLIEICTDGEKGYAVAAADVRASDLKDLFMDMSQQRAGFVRELQDMITDLGAFPENEGTVEGTLHRAWMGVRRGIEGRKDRVIVEEWVRGERKALAAYRSALEEAPLVSLPPRVRALVQRHLAAIQAGVDDAQRYSTLFETHEWSGGKK